MALPQDIPYIRDSTGSIFGFNYGSSMEYAGTEGGQSEDYTDTVLNQCYMLRGNSYTPYTSQCKPRKPDGKPHMTLDEIYEPHSNGNPGLMLAYRTGGIYNMATSYDAGNVHGALNYRNGSQSVISRKAPPKVRIIVGNIDLSHYPIVPYVQAANEQYDTVNVPWGTYKEQYLTSHPYIIGIFGYFYYKQNLNDTSRASDISDYVTLVGGFTYNVNVPVVFDGSGANVQVYASYNGVRQICVGTPLYVPPPLPTYDPIYVPGIGVTLPSYIGAGGVLSTHSPTIQHAHFNEKGRMNWIYINAATAEKIIKSLGLWICDTASATADLHGVYTTSDKIFMPEINKEGMPTGNGWTGGDVEDPLTSPIYNAWDNQNTIYPVGGSDAVGAVKIDISIPPSKEADSDNKELKEDTDELLPEAPLINGLGVFANYYAMSETTILSLSDFLWNADESVIDDVINSLKLFGANPVNAIMSLRLYPFDVGVMSGSVNAEEIILGRVKTGAFGLKLTNAANAILDLGSLYIQSHFDDFRDYAPYSAYNLYIPFIGTVSLNPNDYLNRLITIKMIVDITTGKATAIIYANGIPMQYLDGMIGVEIPITSENMGQTANAIISAVGSTAGALATGNMLNAAMTAAAGAADVLFNDVSINKIGNVSAAAALFAPINAYVVISRPNIVLPGNYGHSRGYACDMSATLINLSGYTVCVNVDTSSIAGATDNERAEIKNLLEGGIYL